MLHCDRTRARASNNRARASASSSRARASAGGGGESGGCPQSFDIDSALVGGFAEDGGDTGVSEHEIDSGVALGVQHPV